MLSTALVDDDGGGEKKLTIADVDWETDACSMKMYIGPAVAKVHLSACGMKRESHVMFLSGVSAARRARCSPPYVY